MRSSIFGLSTLLLIACGPSMHATPIESAADTGQAAQALSSPVRPQPPPPVLDRPDRPRIPQCGACAAYVLGTRTLYLVLADMDPMPKVSVKFLSSEPKNEPIERPELSPAPDGTGRAVYVVPKGPMAGVAEVIVQWTAQGNAQERAAQGRTAKELSAGLQDMWGGWTSLDKN
ncbi:hypothetical protein WME90_25395 [Sorangium sp. So ce375]|uniref:hypothetical protein n=1 Tax=Sorangium sp. So ce375 TaxID=3133306 RepID=UPI003F5BE5AF